MLCTSCEPEIVLQTKTKNGPRTYCLGMIKLNQDLFKIVCEVGTGKSFSEALILASTNPQYDKRLFIELQFST